MEAANSQSQNACLYIWEQMFPNTTKAPELGAKYLKHGITVSGDKICADIEYGELNGKKHITISLSNGQFWRTYEDGEYESGKTRGLDPSFNIGSDKRYNEDEVILALYNYPPEEASKEIVLVIVERAEAIVGKILKIFRYKPEEIARIHARNRKAFKLPTRTNQE